MNNLIKIGLFAVIVFALLTFFEIKDVESQARPTATKTRTRTATATQTLTVTNTVTPSATVTASQTITPSPTLTITPSPTPVQKTEIKVFDNVSIISGIGLKSEVYNVEEFNEVVIFFETTPKGTGVHNTATCYFIPVNSPDTHRFVGISVTTENKGWFDKTGNFGKVLGPRMVCEVNNVYSTTVSMYAYLIP